MSDKIITTVTGRITDDPAAGAPVGAQLKFLMWGFPPHPGIRTEEVTNWDFFRGVVLKTNVADQEVQRVWGSAVMVAPGVALAARHVLDPELEGLISGSSGSIFTGITANGANIWRPRHVIPCPGTDIAIVSLVAASEMASDRTYYQAPISTRIPRSGEPIMILGFVSNEQEFKLKERGYDWDGRLVMACGKVTDHFPTGTAQKPWPMLATDIETIGGMSGGPAFDKDGKLIGILCSGAGEGEHAYSFVSLIWPCLVPHFPLAWLPLRGFENTSLLEMAKRGICYIDKPEAVLTSEDMKGDTVVTLLHWT